MGKRVPELSLASGAFNLQAVEDTVLNCGGEVRRRNSTLRAGCLEERLEMTIALPYLWGVPPAFDSLRYRAAQQMSIPTGALHYAEWISRSQPETHSLLSILYDKPVVV